MDHPPHVSTAAHELTLFPEMGSLLASIEEEVACATSRVWVETYIYRDDTLGRRFASLMARAVGRGVDVRLLYDPLGSQRTSAAFFEELRGVGIDARPYRPARVALLSGHFWPRDHSRLVIVDGAGYMGGAAWGDEWLPKEQGGQGWHEVCCRLAGPSVEDLRRIYLRRWLEADGHIDEPTDFSTGNRYEDLEIVTSAPGPRSAVLDRHRARIQSARTRVWIENAYFFPTRGVVDDLVGAAARGVDVKIIVPLKTDLPSIQRAARASYASWIDQGLQIFQYGRSILHAKFAVVDDDWTSIGTFNLNPTSTAWVNEANLFVYDHGFVQEGAALFERDLDESELLDPSSLRERPLWDKAADVLHSAFFRWLED